MLWYINLGAERWSKHHQRCSESSCGNSSVAARSRSHMATPPPFTKEGGRVACQGGARHPPEESEADGLTGWDRWLLGKPMWGWRKERGKMIYLFANVLSSQQLWSESSFYSVPSCTASYLQPNSEKRKEGQSKAIEHRKVCPLGVGWGVKGMCLESPSLGEKVYQLRREQIHGTRRE